MIINFRKTKTVLIAFSVASSIALNLWAISNLSDVEKSLEGCENYVEQIQAAGERLNALK